MAYSVATDVEGNILKYGWGVSVETFLRAFTPFFRATYSQIFLPTALGDTHHCHQILEPGFQIVPPTLFADTRARSHILTLANHFTKDQALDQLGRLYCDKICHPTAQVDPQLVVADLRRLYVERERFLRNIPEADQVRTILLRLKEEAGRAAQQQREMHFEALNQGRSQQPPPQPYQGAPQQTFGAAFQPVSSRRLQQPAAGQVSHNLVAATTDYLGSLRITAPAHDARHFTATGTDPNLYQATGRIDEKRAEIGRKIPEAWPAPAGSEQTQSRSSIRGLIPPAGTQQQARDSIPNPAEGNGASLGSQVAPQYHHHRLPGAFNVQTQRQASPPELTSHRSAARSSAMLSRDQQAAQNTDAFDDLYDVSDDDKRQRSSAARQVVPNTAEDDPRDRVNPTIARPSASKSSSPKSVPSDVVRDLFPGLDPLPKQDTPPPSQRTSRKSATKDSSTPSGKQQSEQGSSSSSAKGKGPVSGYTAQPQTQPPASRRQGTGLIRQRAATPPRTATPPLDQASQSARKRVASRSTDSPKSSGSKEDTSGQGRRSERGGGKVRKTDKK